jgi:hypothetical protein
MVYSLNFDSNGKLPGIFLASAKASHTYNHFLTLPFGKSTAFKRSYRLNSSPFKKEQQT